MFWYRFSKFDRGLLIGAAVLMLLSTALIIEDRWLFKLLSTSSENLEKIGVTKTAVNDVRRRHGTAFSWLPLEEKSEVYQGDSIYTGEKSEAVILTERGEQIQISPNSLVVINSKTDSIRLDIDYGSVLGQVGKDKKLLIASGGDVTEFKGDDAVVKVDVGNDQNLVVNVLEGQVEVTSDDGSRTLGPRQQAQISDQGAIYDPADIRLELLTPVPDRVLKPDEARDLVLTWRSSYNFPEFAVEIAEDSDFKKIVVKDKVPRPLYRPPTLPTNQRLFWRVSAFLKAGDMPARSPANAFTLAEDTPPAIQFPRNNMRFTFEEQSGGDGRRLEVVLKWAATSASSRWELQVAPIPDFSRDLKIFEVKDTSVNLGGLVEGQYHARVRAKDWMDAQWSDTVSFYLISRPAASLKPPQVLTVDDTFIMTTKPAGFSSQELTTAIPGKSAQYVDAIPELAWNTIPGATSYEIQISATPDFSALVHHEQVPTTRYGWEGVRLGRFFWRIRSINADGRNGVFTQPQRLNVKLAPPQSLTNEKIIEEVTAVTMMESAPPPFLIRWSPTLYTARYEMEFDKDAQMSKPLRLYTPNPFKKVQAATPGVYYWRVRSIDSANRALTEWSPVHKYDYERRFMNPETTKELKALNPVNETLMLIGDGELKIQFKWISPLKNGKYRFQMSSDQEFKTAKYNFMTDKDFFLLREKLPEGWYYWRLRIETEQFTSAWTPAYQFQIKQEQTPFNFERSEKLQEEELKRLEALRKKNMEEQARKDAVEAVVLAKQLEENLPRLQSPGDLENSDSFTLESRALPANVRNLEQLSAIELMKYVREYPTFEWQPVSNANGYQVEIAEDAEFQKRVDNISTQQPAIRWSKVRPGKFYWRVTALGRRFNPSLPSEVKEFEVTLAPVKLSTPNAMLLNTAQGKSVILKWNPAIFARAYEVQFGKTPELTDSKSVKVLTSQHNLAVPGPGLYYWRVRPLDESNKPLAKFSPPRTLNLSVMDRIPANSTQALLLYPLDKGQVYITGDEPARVGFYWKSPQPNGVFVIELAKDADFDEVLHRSTTKRNDLIIDTPVNEGRVYWRLSISSQGRIVWKSPVREFILMDDSKRQPAGN
jgi:hypothetical protein